MALQPPGARRQCQVTTSSSASLLISDRTIWFQKFLRPSPWRASWPWSVSNDHKRIRSTLRRNSTEHGTSRVDRRSLLLTCQFASFRPVQSNIMNFSADIAINEYKSPRCEVNATKKTHRGQDGTRPSFASRVLRLVFKRGHRPTEMQAKSWPGRHEPDCVVVPTASEPHFSPNISIPNSLASSAPSATPTAHTRLQRVRMRTVDAEGYSEDHWRQRQTYCANCERLFLKSMSSLSSTAGRFCSLDCKANFEYLTQIQEVMNDQIFGSSILSSVFCSKGSQSFE